MCGCVYVVRCGVNRVPVYSAPHHTRYQGKSIKLIKIITHFPYNVIFLLHIIVFYCILLYFILFIAELHMQPHLARFYHNSILPYCILSFNNSQR